MITKAEARMIARELYSLWKEDHEELVGVDKASSILGLSSSYIYHNLDKIPHTRVGRAIRFSPSGLKEFSNLNI